MAIVSRGQMLPMIATEAMRPIQTITLSIRSSAFSHSSVGASQ
jgi:hypothetical protein